MQHPARPRSRCPVYFLLTRRHGIDSTWFGTLATVPDMRGDQAVLHRIPYFTGF